MSDLVRFGVSLKRVLLERFDGLIHERKYTNRSEAIRDLIRQELVKKEWEDDREVAGAITFVYDHHTQELVHRIIDIQHNFQNVIISTQHIHLDHDNCLEIVAVRGKAKDVQEVADLLKSVRGVRYGSLSMSSIGHSHT